MLSQLTSQMTYRATDSGRSDAIRKIEAAFARTLKNEGVKATISFTDSFASVIVDSEDNRDKVKAFLAQVDKMTYEHTDFYPADEDMPAEWYLRYRY